MYRQRVGDAPVSRTRQVADFVARASADGECSPAVVDNAVAAILDTVAVMLAGARELAPRAVAATCTTERTGCAVVGMDPRFGSADAALIGGTAAHVLDFDDVHVVPKLGHPSAVVVPALLAIAHEHDLTGREFVDAYAVAIEVGVRLGGLLGESHYLQGWHATGNIGALRAAAGVCRALGLDAEATAQALGVAGSVAGGLRANFGTMTKSMHAGNAARAGVLAAVLARDGFTANDDVVDADLGFLAAFGADRTEREPLRLGDPWELERGLVWKRFPSCAASHAAIEAALSVGSRMRDDGKGVDDVRRVHVTVGYDAIDALRYRRPARPLEAKFSAEYCVASALLDGAPGLSHFTEAALQREECRSLMARTVVQGPDGARDGRRATRAATVTLDLADGTSLDASDSGAAVHVGGSNPDMLTAKALDCFAWAGWPRGEAEAMWQELATLEQAPSVRELFEPLHVDRASTAASVTGGRG